jgi:hypothetical protein
VEYQAIQQSTGMADLLANIVRLSAVLLARVELTITATEEIRLLLCR